jgi:hypothetical protein
MPVASFSTVERPDAVRRSAPVPCSMGAPPDWRHDLPRRRNRTLRTLVALGAAACLLAGLSGCAHGATGAGADDAPPWSAPAGEAALAAHAADADLRNVWGERLAEHVHAHVSITDDGVPVTIPGDIGHDASLRFAAQLHTHDTSGIVHVESPTRDAFTLGQFFTEWGVGLGADHVGGLVGPGHGGRLTMWVDGHRWFGDPASIELTDLRQIDLVVTHAGQAPHEPTPFDWPPQYH